MKSFAIASVIAGFALAGIAQAQTHHLTVQASDDIFAAGLSASEVPAGMGTTPPSSPVLGGHKVTIKASGVVTCCGPGGTKSGPAGFASNPFGNGSTITNSLSTGVGAFHDRKGAFALVAVFAGDHGPKGAPIKVGAHAALTAPAWANRIYLGFADANGFNGPSGAYSDNGGSVSVDIH